MNVWADDPEFAKAAIDVLQDEVASLKAEVGRLRGLLSDARGCVAEVKDMRFERAHEYEGYPMWHRLIAAAEDAAKFLKRIDAAIDAAREG